MAVVVDEGGSVRGVVTQLDLLGAIAWEMPESGTGARGRRARRRPPNAAEAAIPGKSSGNGGPGQWPRPQLCRIHPDTNKPARPGDLFSACDGSKSHKTTGACSEKWRECAVLVNSMQSLPSGAIRHKSRRVSPRLTTKVLPQICVWLDNVPPT